MTTTTLTHFDQIAKALDFESMTTEEQGEMLLDLNALIFRGTMIRLIDRMDEKTRKAFGKLMEADPSEQKVQSFIDKNVPNADSALLETVQDLTDDILAVSNNS